MHIYNILHLGICNSELILSKQKLKQFFRKKPSFLAPFSREKGKYDIKNIKLWEKSFMWLWIGLFSTHSLGLNILVSKKREVAWMIYKILSEFNDKILVIKKRCEQLCNDLAIPLLGMYFRDNENIWPQLVQQCTLQLFIMAKNLKIVRQ